MTNSVQRIFPLSYIASEKGATWIIIYLIMLSGHFLRCKTGNVACTSNQCLTSRSTVHFINYHGEFAAIRNHWHFRTIYYHHRKSSWIYVGIGRLLNARSWILRHLQAAHPSLHPIKCNFNYGYSFTWWNATKNAPQWTINVQVFFFFENSRCRYRTWCGSPKAQ